MNSQSWQQAEVHCLCTVWYEDMWGTSLFGSVPPSRRCPWAFGMRKQFKWNMVWETVLKKRGYSSLIMPFFLAALPQNFGKEQFSGYPQFNMQQNTALLPIHVYFMLWERHWYHSLGKLTLHETEIIPSTLNLISQDLWTSSYYCTVQKCLKVFQAFHWATRNRHSFPKSSNIYVPNME